MSEIAKPRTDTGISAEVGGPATGGTLADGAFCRPALLEVEDVTTDIVQKEVFGPVATFEIFDTETDAISRANATEYGLAASIFTSDTTAASFRTDGSWTVQTEPGAEPFQV